jgi:hypothetical protein
MEMRGNKMILVGLLSILFDGLVNLRYSKQETIWEVLRDERASDNN